MRPWQRIICSLTAFFLICAAFCCDSIQDALKSSSSPSTQSANPSPKPASLSLPTETVELEDVAIKFDSNSLGSVDLRPIWIIEGRIHNLTEGKTIKQVTVRFTFKYQSSGVEMDGEDVRFETKIPPNGVRSFSRRLQLLPPQHKEDYNLGCDVVSVEAEP